MLQLIDKKKKLFFYLILFILLSTQITINQKDQKNSIIKLKQIEVFGLSDKNNIKISESLNSLLFKNIFLINKNDFYEILEKNNLIESFYVKKFYPDIIKIDIKKTDFLAMTNKNNNKFYIGSNGKLIPIGEVKNLNKQLPFVFSKSNYDNFVDLKKIIDKSKFQFEKIKSFYYFPGNRWDIKTNNELLIRLPEKNILESLELAHLIIEKEEFIDNKIIDLRISNTIIASNE